MAERKILCVSFDKLIGNLRREALTEVGYRVSGTTHPADALEQLAADRFDLVIVGHRFEEKDKRDIALACTKRQTPMLLVCGKSENDDIPATARVRALDGMIGLLKAVAGLFAQHAAGHSAA